MKDNYKDRIIDNLEKNILKDHVRATKYIDFIYLIPYDIPEIKKDDLDNLDVDDLIGLFKKLLNLSKEKNPKYVNLHHFEAYIISFISLKFEDADQYDELYNSLRKLLFAIKDYNSIIGEYYGDFSFILRVREILNCNFINSINPNLFKAYLELSKKYDNGNFRQNISSIYKEITYYYTYYYYKLNENKRYELLDILKKYKHYITKKSFDSYSTLLNILFENSDNISIDKIYNILENSNDLYFTFIKKSRYNKAISKKIINNNFLMFKEITVTNFNEKYKNEDLIIDYKKLKDDLLNLKCFINDKNIFNDLIMSSSFNGKIQMAILELLSE